MWCKIVIDFIDEKIKRLEDNNKINLEIDIPNGCCNKNDCPIKIYYEYVINEINDPEFYKKQI